MRSITTFTSYKCLSVQSRETYFFLKMEKNLFFHLFNWKFEFCAIYFCYDQYESTLKRYVTWALISHSFNIIDANRIYFIFCASRNVQTKIQEGTMNHFELLQFQSMKAHLHIRIQQTRIDDRFEESMSNNNFSFFFFFSSFFLLLVLLTIWMNHLLNGQKSITSQIDWCIYVKKVK